MVFIKKSTIYLSVGSAVVGSGYHVGPSVVGRGRGRLVEVAARGVVTGQRVGSGRHVGAGSFVVCGRLVVLHLQSLVVFGRSVGPAGVVVHQCHPAEVKKL